MLKRRIYSILGTFLISIALVVVLYIYSEYRENVRNSFIRKLPPFKITAEKVKGLITGSYYIVGKSGGNLYLGSHYSKLSLLKFNTRSLDTSTNKFILPDGFKLFKSAFFNVDSDHVYLFDAMAGNIVVRSVQGNSLLTNISSTVFTQALPLSGSSFIFASINEKRQNVLVKQSGNVNNLLIKDNVLKKQVDGLFCTDGILVKVPRSKKVIYVYRYRNQFITTDTNLNVLYYGKTIDTNSIAKIKVAEIKSDNEVTLASPPFYVNKQASANEKYLFILSALKADNETDKVHKTCAAIDVYAVNDGKYQFSFYLPDFNGEKLTEFKVHDKTLVALFGHYLYTFKLNF